MPQACCGCGSAGGSWQVSHKLRGLQLGTLPLECSITTRVVHLLLSFHWKYNRSCLPSIRDSCAESTSVVTSKTSAALPGIILPECSSYRDIVPVSGLRHAATIRVSTSSWCSLDLDTPSLTSTHTKRQLQWGVWPVLVSKAITKQMKLQFQSTCRLSHFWQRNSGSEVDQTISGPAFIALYNKQGKDKSTGP
jgi:hypothetical protein